MHNYFKGIPKDWIPLGRQFNNSKDLISEVLSGLLTAYVDIAKDPYILDINAINKTANTVLMMTRWGLKLKEVFYFINQPIIKSYLKERSLQEAVSSTLDTGKRTKEQSITKMLMDFGLAEKYGDLIYGIEKKIEDDKLTEANRLPQGHYSDFSIMELEKDIKSYAKNKSYDKRTQLKALDLFLEYDRQSTLFSRNDS